MVQGKWFPTGSDLSQPLAVRQAVFGRGRDALDDWAQQVAVYAGAEPVGDVGVRPDRRGKGYGDLLVRLLLFKALSHGARFIRLEAPSEAVAFFARYGFREERCRDGQTIMGLAAADVRLDRCGGSCAGCGLCPAEPQAGSAR